MPVELLLLPALAAAEPSFPMPYAGIYPREYVHDLAFPEGFVWGTGTASYQIEGGWNDGGRGRSIWDTFSGAGGGTPNPGHEVLGDVGDVACDHYHKWKEDVALMRSLGLKSYRFSIAWPRLLPNGTLAGGVSQAGVTFYNGLIDELLASGITPYVTLYHWDLPETLQTASLQGWLDRRLVKLFAEYAGLCFTLFGDRVKYWTTFNEAWTFTVLGYGSGSKAPGRPYANIATHPYLAGHTVLLAHAAAVGAYRAHANGAGGKIGITNNCDWNEPASDRPEDVAAAERANEWWLAWFADPIWLGDYPASMRAKLGDRLPRFTDAEKESLRGSADFFGLNHYGSKFAAHQPTPPGYGTSADAPYSYWSDYEASDFHTPDAAGRQSHAPDMPRGASVWLYSVPWGLRKLLNWVHRRYGPAVHVYVTENGWSTPGDDGVEAGVDDP